MDSGPVGADAWRRVVEMIGGFRLSQAIGVAARLGVADALADGPLTSAALAARLGVAADPLHRLLRALAAAGLFTLDGALAPRHGPDDAEPAWRLTPLGACLRADVPWSLRDQAMLYTEPAMWAAWGELAHVIHTGRNAFQHVHGVDVWTWRARRQDASAVFDRAMGALARRVGDVIDAFGLDRFDVMVDVGGGRGVLLIRALIRHPHLRGILLDRDGLQPEAPDPTLLARCEVVAGSFFDPLPRGDAYVLKHVLHNWEDEPALCVLRRVAVALPPSGRVFVVERELDDGGLDLHLMDLHMAVGPGGRERTRAELVGLLAAAGLLALAFTSTGSGLVIEAARAG